MIGTRSPRSRTRLNCPVHTETLEKIETESAVKNIQRENDSALNSSHGEKADNENVSQVGKGITGKLQIIQNFAEKDIALISSPKKRKEDNAVKNIQLENDSVLNSSHDAEFFLSRLGKNDFKDITQDDILKAKLSSLELDEFGKAFHLFEIDGDEENDDDESDYIDIPKFQEEHMGLFPELYEVSGLYYLKPKQPSDDTLSFDSDSENDSEDDLFVSDTDELLKEIKECNSKYSKESYNGDPCSSTSSERQEYKRLPYFKKNDFHFRYGDKLHIDVLMAFQKLRDENYLNRQPPTISVPENDPSELNTQRLRHNVENSEGFEHFGLNVMPGIYIEDDEDEMRNGIERDDKLEEERIQSEAKKAALRSNCTKGQRKTKCVERALSKQSQRKIHKSVKRAPPKQSQRKISKYVKESPSKLGQKRISKSVKQPISKQGQNKLDSASLQKPKSKEC